MSFEHWKIMGSQKIFDYRKSRKGVVQNPNLGQKFRLQNFLAFISLSESGQNSWPIRKLPAASPSTAFSLQKIRRKSSKATTWWLFWTFCPVYRFFWQNFSPIFVASLGQPVIVTSGVSPFYKIYNILHFCISSSRSICALVG